jgi:hypothetical protein
LAIVVVAIALPMAALWREGIGAVSDPQTDVHSVAPQGATSARAELALSTGGLDLRAGTDDLMNGTFAYNVADWRPAISYAVADGVGRLRVTQGNGGLVLPWDAADANNAWDVRLSGAIPLALDVKVGAGRSDLMLADLDLTELDIALGSGTTTINLAGARERDLHGAIAVGAGPATVYLPRDTGVRVTVIAGAGEVVADGLERDGAAYVNDAYGTTPVALQLVVRSGAGDVNLVVAG